MVVKTVYAPPHPPSQKPRIFLIHFQNLGWTGFLTLTWTPTVKLASINLNGTLSPPHTEQQVLKRHPMFEAGRLLAKQHAPPGAGNPDVTLRLI